MYELGYDKLFLRDNGQERLGLAFDYMKGSTSYDDIAGKGNNSRKGICFMTHGLVMMVIIAIIF